MAKKQAGKEVAVSAPSVTGTELRPTWMGDQTSVRGNEGVGMNDMTVPRIAIIQDLSPYWKENKDEYIPGAKPKMAFNTATKELYGSNVFIIPVLFRKEWVVWKDIDSGGGFKGAYPSELEAVRAMAELPDKDECEVVDTHQHFVMVVNPEDPDWVQHAVISMSKSQCKPSRQLNTMIQSVGGDRFERIYKLEVVDAKNAAGQEYYNWMPTQLGFCSEAQFKSAEALYNAVKDGIVDVKRDQEAAATAEHKSGSIDDETEF